MVWASVSGALVQKHMAPTNYYASLLATPLERTKAHEIEKVLQCCCELHSVTVLEYLASSNDTNKNVLYIQTHKCTCDTCVLNKLSLELIVTPLPCLKDLRRSFPTHPLFQSHARVEERLAVCDFLL